MTDIMPSRDAGLALLKRYNTNNALIQHAMAVEAAMRYLARQTDQDEALWGLVGLIHDLDYEQFADQHCHKTAEILRSEGWPELIVRAVLSHGWKLCTDVEPISKMEKTLYAVDELTGLIAATALVRPSKSIFDVKVKSVKKKWKAKAFAAGVNREVIQAGADMLNMDLNDLIDQTIAGMREVADDIGLKGASEPSSF
jgi:putative nucleotidyltransferase with HDIG domain